MHHDSSRCIVTGKGDKSMVKPWEADQMNAPEHSADRAFGDKRVARISAGTVSHKASSTLR